LNGKVSLRKRCWRRKNGRLENQRSARLAKKGYARLESIFLGTLRQSPTLSSIFLGSSVIL
jgi:hypothetical protein